MSGQERPIISHPGSATETFSSKVSIMSEIPPQNTQGLPSASDAKMSTENTPPRRESFLANLLLNIVIPAVILSKLSSEAYLGTQWAIVVALAFPLGYGLRDFFTTRKINLLSALGFISILLTGGISLLQLDPQYIAIKEAAIPGLIGLATLFSIKTRYPLVKTFVYNGKILRIEKITAALEAYGTQAEFDKVLRNTSYMIAGSFFLSSLLNYVLAKIVMVSPAGTEAFNIELGRMTALSYPVIVIPAMIVMMASLFYLFRNIRRLTQLSLEDVINDGSGN